MRARVGASSGGPGELRGGGAAISSFLINHRRGLGAGEARGSPALLCPGRVGPAGAAPHPPPPHQPWDAHVPTLCAAGPSVWASASRLSSGTSGPSAHTGRRKAV